MEEAFDRTYEGLKPAVHAQGYLSGGAFDRTYEGLKLARVLWYTVGVRTF